MEKLCCHGDAIGTNLEVIDSNMLEGGYSLKAKIISERKIYSEKKPFKERKEVIEEFFKSNVEEMLENRKYILSTEERRKLNALDREISRELNYEMNPYTWKLIKLPNGKMKTVIVEEDDKYKDLGLDDDVNIIKIGQIIIDSLEIHEVFPKRMLNYCIFTKNDYFKKREEEKKFNRVLKIMPREILPRKLIFVIKES
jgi:hypothetical protein